MTRLIVFFIPPVKDVNGGILSIFSIAKLSRDFKDIHHAEVRLCVYPGHDSYGKNDLFENDEIIYSFDEIVKLGSPDWLQLHVPEYASSIVFNALKPYASFLDSVGELSVNILNQNIRLMPDPLEISKWFSLTPYVSQTTAHDRYSTQQVADRYCLVTHRLSVYLDPTNYRSVDFAKKSKVILLSPDETEHRSKIIDKLTVELPDYELVTVKNMKYEDFKKLAAEAKFTVTFGEGMDGYYIEAFFSGSICFAVYNDDFFPDRDFADFPNNYQSYEEMLAKLVEDIKRHDKPAAYEKIVKVNVAKLCNLYDFNRYRENLKNFYLQKYSFVPGTASFKAMIHRLSSIVEYTQLMMIDSVKKSQAVIDEKNERIGQLEKELYDNNVTLQNMVNSRSWRLTKPLRRKKG